MVSTDTERAVEIDIAGIRLIRKGECRRCGFCCRACPHLFPRYDGIRVGYYTCLIYDRRGERCEQCKAQHSLCIDFPQSPKKHLNPECGYSFYTEDGREIIKVEGR